MHEYVVDSAVEDRLAIRELIDRYHAAINHGDVEMLASVFAEDAVWEVGEPVNLRFVGRAAIVEGLHRTVNRQEVLIQSSSGLVIRCTAPSLADVQSTLIEFGRERGTGKGWCAVGFYYDTVIKDDRAWRFKQRSLQLRSLGDVPVLGQVYPGIRLSTLS